MEEDKRPSSSSSRSFLLFFFFTLTTKFDLYVTRTAAATAQAAATTTAKTLVSTPTEQDQSTSDPVSPKPTQVPGPRCCLLSAPYTQPIPAKAPPPAALNPKTEDAARMCTQTVLTTHLCRKCGSPMSNTTTTITTPCEGGTSTSTSNSSSSSSFKRCPGTCPGAGKTITKTAKSGKVCGACTLEEVRIYTGSF